VDNFTDLPELAGACRFNLGEATDLMELVIFCKVWVWEDLGGTAMEAYQWFLLGMMVAWTPGMLALGFMLWRHEI
jgi:hypothetical protein